MGESKRVTCSGGNESETSQLFGWGCAALGGFLYLVIEDELDRDVEGVAFFLCFTASHFDHLTPFEG